PEFDGEEISNEMLRVLAAYVDGLQAPPAVDDPRGAALFAATGCAACHVPDMPALGGGTVRVFSDLLLHDMGPGLDDGVGEPGVLSSEWRTAPLLTLSTRTGTDRRYLHDGRAATIADAVLAHGGEADPARSRFEALSGEDRAALLAYLETL
ncbi:MAG: c-type cytochrome, partial [Rhizobiales bacterium]|nr:c-type cytochrome [Hyphomicrobiales bacterium]